MIRYTGYTSIIAILANESKPTLFDPDEYDVIKNGDLISIRKISDTTAENDLSVQTLIQDKQPVTGEVTAIYYARRVVSQVMYGLKVVWQKISSCFGSGKWIDAYKWKDSENWKY